MWNLINCLQLLYYLPLVKIAFPTLSKQFFKILEFTVADFFDMLPNYVNMLITIEDLEDYSLGERFDDLELESVYIVIMYESKLAMWMFIFSLYPMALLLKQCATRGRCGKFASWLNRILYYNFPLQLQIEMYLEMSVVVMI